MDVLWEARVPWDSGYERMRVVDCHELKDRCGVDEADGVSGKGAGKVSLIDVTECPGAVVCREWMLALRGVAQAASFVSLSSERGWDVCRTSDLDIAGT